MTPLKKWELGIFVDGAEIGFGVRSRPTDTMSVLLDFLPSFYRTVQTFGVTVDGLTYYAEALRPWINAKDKSTGNKSKLVFRRDPRDISTLWFFDPDLKQYYKIPFADQSLPSMSVWEFIQAKERLKKQGFKNVNEHEILRAITELRDQVEQAKQKSRKARRQAQRRLEHEKPVSEVLPSVTENAKPAPIEQAQQAYDNLLVDGDIETFEDMA